MTKFVITKSAKVEGDKQFLFEQLRLMQEHLTSIYNTVTEGNELTIQEVENIPFIDNWLCDAFGEFNKWYAPAMVAIIDHIESCEVKEPTADAS